MQALSWVHGTHPFVIVDLLVGEGFQWSSGCCKCFVSWRCNSATSSGRRSRIRRTQIKHDAADRQVNGHGAGRSNSPCPTGWS